MKLPGEAVFHLKLKNWRGSCPIHNDWDELPERAFKFRSGTPQVNLPAYSDRTIEIRALPTKVRVFISSRFVWAPGSFELKEAVVLAAIEPGKALAYAFDYDRDGFDDVILENQKIRCFISPNAGGRSFALVLKDSNRNAFNSVGGMRDTFAKRVEPRNCRASTSTRE